MGHSGKCLGGCAMWVEMSDVQQVPPLFGPLEQCHCLREMAVFYFDVPAPRIFFIRCSISLHNSLHVPCSC